MKTGVIVGKGEFVFEDVPKRVLRQGGAIVRITLCGICGSDVSAYKTGAPYPKGLCGHELVGVVEEISVEIPGVDEGTRIVVSGPPPCATRCPACLQGHYEACSNIAQSLLGADGFSPDSGGFASRQLIDARRLVPVPASLTDQQAAMAEPATVATRGVLKSGIRPGQSAVVLGAGPIGLFAIQTLKAGGVRDIVVIDPDVGRRSVALKVGASHGFSPGEDGARAVLDLTAGLGPDFVFECSGASTALHDAARLCRHMGTVVMIGVSAVPVMIEPVEFLLKELTMITSMGFDKNDTMSVLRLLESGKILTDPLYSETIPLGETANAISELAKGSDKIKVLVAPEG